MSDELVERERQRLLAAGYTFDGKHWWPPTPEWFMERGWQRVIASLPPLENGDEVFIDSGGARWFRKSARAAVERLIESMK